MAPQMWNSGAMKRELGFDDEGRPVLITAAAPAYEEQHRARVRKYLTIMSFRIPALILAAVAYGIWHNGLISLAIVAVSIPLPWIAVLIANDRPRGGPRNPPLRERAAAHRAVPRAERPALEVGLSATAQPRAAHVVDDGSAERRRARFSADSQIAAVFLHFRGCEMTIPWELFCS